jgi:hypothetical protein
VAKDHLCGVEAFLFGRFMGRFLTMGGIVLPFMLGQAGEGQGQNDEKQAESRYGKGFEASAMHILPEIWRKDKGA